MLSRRELFQVGGSGFVGAVLPTSKLDPFAFWGPPVKTWLHDHGGITAACAVGAYNRADLIQALALVNPQFGCPAEAQAPVSIAAQVLTGEHTPLFSFDAHDSEPSDDEALVAYGFDWSEEGIQRARCFGPDGEF